MPERIQNSNDNEQQPTATTTADPSSYRSPRGRHSMGWRDILGDSEKGNHHRAANKSKGPTGQPGEGAETAEPTPGKNECDSGAAPSNYVSHRPSGRPSSLPDPGLAVCQQMWHVIFFLKLVAPHCRQYQSSLL